MRTAYPSAVREQPKISRRQNAFPMIRPAAPSSPRPLAWENSGAPPIPHRLANATMMLTAGAQMPMPVRASRPVSAIRPMYIRSTRLYSTFMICAAIMGPAMRRMLEGMLPMAKFPLSRPPCLAVFTVSTSVSATSIRPPEEKRNRRRRTCRIDRVFPS